MPAPASLVEQNLRLVGYVVNRTRTVLEREDAEAEARLGLLKAAQGFDPARGVAFSTYAVPTLVRHVQRGSRKAQDAREHEFSGDVPLTEAGDGETLLELQPDPQAIDPEEAALRALERQELEAALSRLKPRTARFLRLKYGLDATPLGHAGAAEAVGVSRQGAWSLERRALKQLRELLGVLVQPD